MSTIKSIKKVLFTGDSLTAGRLGCSFTKLIAEEFPQYAITNLGKDGDTTAAVMKRTIRHLKSSSDYDLIVITAGHNDIILPAFANKSTEYRYIAALKKLQGSVPASGYEDFIKTYERFADAVIDKSNAAVVITTLSCLNEDSNAPTNIRRLMYNRGLTELAKKKNLCLADVGSEFDKLLQQRDCRDYFMSDLYESALFDRNRAKTEEGAAGLSRKRGLHLTIDGIHLNRSGAELYLKKLLPFFRNI